MANLKGEDKIHNPSYGLTWKGKNKVIDMSKDKPLGKLKLNKTLSKNYKTTSNIYIKGDNLEGLKLLEEHYYKRIKLIYIDPPYNTGRSFVYKDDYRYNIKTYLEKTNQININNPETLGRYHISWLNMMYPRLVISKRLLMDDGIIFISIDDNEYHNLRLIMDEIFGLDNFIGTIVRRRRSSQANLSSNNLSTVHEYVVCYSNTKDGKLNRIKKDINSDKYSNPDDDPRGPYVTMPCSNKGGSRYEIVTPKGTCHLDDWRFKRDTFEKLLRDKKIVFPKNGYGKPRYKLFLRDKIKKGVITNSWWDDVSSNQEATRELKQIFNNKALFENPKPLDFIKKIILLGSNEDDIILDFFSGSGTTAHAVMEINKEEKSHRKYILIQNPEKVKKKTMAYKVGYKTIWDIGRERIDKSGEIIKNKSINIDIGFKTYEIVNK